MIALRSIRQRRTAAASQAKHAAFMRMHARQERRTYLDIRKWRAPVIDRIVAALREWPNSQPVGRLIWTPTREDEASFRRVIRRDVARMQLAGASLESQYIETATGADKSKAKQGFGVWVDRFASVSQIAPAGNEVDPDSIYIEFSQEMRAAVDSWTAAREVGVWTQISEGTQIQLARAVSDGLADGLSIDDLTKLVRSRLTHYDDVQARRVARTEATGAMNNGADASMIDAEVPFHEWIRTIDRRTRGYDPKRKSRFDHYNASQTVPLADPFVVSGQRLRFPGDTSLGASAGNTINCRCSAAAAFDGVKAPKTPPPSPPPAPKPPKAPRVEKPTPAPKPPKPTALPPEKPKSLEERVRLAGEREDIREMRRKITEASAKFDAEHKSAIAAKAAADERLSQLAKDIETFNRDVKAGRLADEEKRRQAASLQQRLKDVDKTRRDAIDRFQSVDNERRAETANVLGKPGSRPFDLTKKSKPSQFMESDGKIVKVTPPDDAYYDKAVEARRFIGRMYKPADGKPIEVEMWQLPKGKRAFASGERIFLTAGDDVSIFAHELAHQIENASEEIRKLTREFVEMRIKRAGTSDVRLADIFPKGKFNRDEFGNPDHFAAAFGHDSAYYVGKLYKEGQTELLSMSIELLYRDAAKLANADPELFSFVVSVLGGTL